EPGLRHRARAARQAPAEPADVRQEPRHRHVGRRPRAVRGRRGVRGRAPRFRLPGPRARRAAVPVAPAHAVKVPFVDLGPQHAETAEDALSAIRAIVKAGRFILGEPVARFERALAEVCGVAHAVGVASGTDALVLALVAAGVGPGDLVATTPLTFAATA